MKQCGAETTESCMTDHIALPAGARRRGRTRTWRAPCPVCARGDLPLDLTIGHTQRIVWYCNASACDGVVIKKALIAEGVPESCIPWDGKPAQNPDGVRAESDGNLSAKLAEIEQIIRADSANPQRIRLLVGMVLWECGRGDAATELGISRATAYRAVSPVRQNPKTRKSHA